VDLCFPENPKKITRDPSSFLKNIEDFPQSPWSERAKIWLGILQENEKLTQRLKPSTEE